MQGTKQLPSDVVVGSQTGQPAIGALPSLVRPDQSDSVQPEEGKEAVSPPSRAPDEHRPQDYYTIIVVGS